jgi:hypothetical protein
MAVQWGLLDSDMPAKIGGSFQQGQRNALAMQGAQQGQQMNAMKMQQAQQEAQSQNALSEAYRSSGGDMAKLKENLLAGGHFEPAMKLGKMEAEQQKSALAAKKAELDDHVTKIGVVAQLLSSAHDQPSLDAAIQEAASVAGPEFVQNVPKVYNPSELQFAIKKGLSVKDQAYNASKEIDQQLRQQEIAAMGGYRQQQLAQGEERLGLQERQVGIAEKQAAKPTKGAAGGINPEQRIQDAQDVLGILAEAAPLIDKATSSYLGKGVSEAARTFGASTDAADAAAALATLQGSLISKMPKMTGPQSDKDVLLYREMAGKIGDPTVPASQKKAAMNEIAKINARYAGVDVPTLDYSGKKSTAPKTDIPSDWTDEEEAAYRRQYGD